MSRAFLGLPAMASFLPIAAGTVWTQPQTVMSLDEMEGDVAARWGDVAGTGSATLVADTEIVKEGEQSGLWDPESAAREIFLKPDGMPGDWAQYGALEFWVHSEKATGAVFAVAVYAENAATDGEDCYRCLIPVDWEGWRFVHLEPRSFAPVREPVGWHQVTSLRLAIGGWADLKYVLGTRLRFDAIRLRAVWESPERRVLFEPDTDWCAWWPLTYATAPVRTGRYVAEWYPAERPEGAADRSIPSDWSGSAYLNAWLHAEHAGGLSLTVTGVSESDRTPEPDGYQAVVEVDWDGWNLVSVPLSEFQRLGEPVGWQAVSELRLAASWAGPAQEDARVCIDDIWLSAFPGDTGAAPTVAEAGSAGLAGADVPTVIAPGDTAASAAPAASAGQMEKLLAEALESKRAGNLELSFTKYIAVLLKQPDSVEAHWGIAWVLAQQGEKEAACEHFRKVVELARDPGRTREAREALARLQAGE